MKPRFELLQVEPTTRCNFTCGFCCGRKMPQEDIPFERFARILDSFKGVRRLELQGEGEPLLHPRFFEMAALARSRKIKLHLITNGSFFSRANVDRILDIGIESLMVSMESADAETFQDIRGGKLDKVITGLRLLLSERQRRRARRPAVGLAITVLKRTQAHIAGIYRLYEELGLDGGIALQHLQRMPDYVPAYDEAMRGQTLTRREIAAFTRTHLQRARASLTHPRPRRGRTFYGHLFDGWVPESRTCPWLERAAYVARDGVVTPCCMVKDPRHSLGNIADTPVAEIARRRRAIADELKSGVMPAACRGCQIAQAVVNVAKDEAEAAAV